MATVDEMLATEQERERNARGAEVLRLAKEAYEQALKRRPELFPTDPRARAEVKALMLSAFTHGYMAADPVFDALVRRKPVFTNESVELLQ